YIARMDGDDISLPERFEKQVAILNKNQEIKACGCWLKEFGWSNKIIKHKEYHDEIVASLLVGCSMTLGSVMLDRKWVENILFDETKKHVEDYDFWSRVAWTGKLYNIQEILYNYRIHSNQVSTVYKDVQKRADISIKLFLLKKIDYKSNLYTDELISKMLLLDTPITLADFGLFLKWLKKLVFLNRKSKIYSQKELENVLKSIKRALLFNLYFKKTAIGITKNWRLMALFKLNMQDASYILRIKSREIRKALEKAK
ncbi:MAG: glycosyltransferase family protein, partial [Lutibacter sp.]